MTTMTTEQIEQKKLQLVEKVKQMKALTKELVEAGAIELSEEDLDKVAGGNPCICVVHPDRGTMDWIEVPDSLMPVFTRPKDQGVEEPKAILPPGM